MAKKNGLHISKDVLEGIINKFAYITNSEVKNPVNKQTRYHLDKDGKEFYIDVYFRTDKTLTVFPMTTGCYKGSSEELVQIIKSYEEYQNVTTGSFSCIYNTEMFNALIEYLTKLEGVTKLKDEDKGINGHIVQFISEIGDKITLTFYQSTSKLLYQGLLMKLYIEVKSFIGPSVGNIKTEINKIGQEHADKSEEIEKLIGTYIPLLYKNSIGIIQGFIYDSFTLITANNTLSDYSSWTFPILKALEYRIKQILEYEKIYLDDTKGFKYCDSNGIWTNIFRHNGKCFVVDSKLARKCNQITIDVLPKSYTFFNANRNTLFHTKQQVTATRILETSDKAKAIILEACDLLENSYKKLGK